MVDVRDWIEFHSNRTPDAVAQIDHVTQRQFTYREMQDRVSCIAGYLRNERKVGVGDVVAVVANNSSDILDIDSACGRIGAIFFPVNTRLAASEMAFQFKDAEPKILFVGKEFQAVAEEATKLAGLHSTSVLLADGDNKSEFESIATDSQRLEKCEPRKPSDGWTLMYSSGTTGRPKGILHTHGGVTMQAIGNCVPMQMGPLSSSLTVLPLFHISGLNLFPHAIFYSGGKQITLGPFDPGEMLSALANPDYGVTHVTAVPTIFEMISQLPQFESADLSVVRAAFVGGAPSTKRLLTTYAAKGMPLVQGYGLTETGPTMTVLDPEDAVSKLGSAGKPLMHVDVRILREDDSDTDTHEVGEIITRGPSVITEYFKRPEAQQTSFMDGWLKTGDMGYFDDEGFLFIADRKKDMYISGGENVYPAEVENCIAQLEDVLQVSVVGVPDEKWGEVGAACIVKKDGSDLSEEDVIEFSQQQVARYKAPKFVRFFDALPVSGSGKVLKRELKKTLEVN